MGGKIMTSLAGYVWWHNSGMGVEGVVKPLWCCYLDPNLVAS